MRQVRKIRVENETMTENDRTIPMRQGMPNLSILRAELGTGEAALTDEDLQQIWWILYMLTAMEVPHILVQGRGPLSRLLENINVPRIHDGGCA